MLATGPRRRNGLEFVCIFGTRRGNRMSNKPLRTDVASCRAGMAKLLTKAVAITRKLERWLDVTGGWREATARIDLDADPTATLRIVSALLLCKARIHTVAVLRANETSNLHSLAVQMRPVLECAGQVVFFFHNTMIAPNLLMAPERAAEVVGNRLNADHYQTLRRRTKGEVSPEELREVEAQAQEAAAAFVGLTKPKRRNGRRLNQADKVATLEGGQQWYRYLSEHFSHGKATDWRGLSWRGGVMTIDRVEDEFAFLGLMDYLVKQVALMNAHAALCPGAEDKDDQWNRWIEPTLAELRDVRESSKALRDAAMSARQEGLDGNARTD